jgi:hypothetical protein
MKYIDLKIKNKNGKLLIFKSLNRPYRGYCFDITNFKDETTSLLVITKSQLIKLREQLKEVK